MKKEITSQYQLSKTVNLKVFALLCFCTLLQANSLLLFAADYCGQPVPHDIAHEGYKQPTSSFVDNAFSDPDGAQMNEQPSQNQQALSGEAIYIPPGSSIPITLDRPIGSNISHVGETAYAYVSGNNYGIPSGTIAELVILMVEPAARGFSRPGKIQIGANRLILPNNQSVWLRGLIVDSRGKDKLVGQSGGSRVGRSLGKAALGAGLGAASGAGVGAIAKGNLAPAIWLGTAIGFVIGGIWAATAKGKEVTLPSGMQVFLSVSQGAQSSY
jgi:hypothetical protein